MEMGPGKIRLPLNDSIASLFVHPLRPQILGGSGVLVVLIRLLRFGEMLFRLVFLVAAALSLMITAGCEQGIGHVPPQPTVLPVTAMVLHRQASFAYPVTYYGRVEAARSAALSFERAGRLDAVLLEEGARVPSGVVVARLDTSALEAEQKLLITQRGIESSLLDRLRRGERDEVIKAAQADVKRLDVEVTRALSEKERADRVYASRAISRADYEQAFYSYRAAVHALDQAQQRLEELRSGTRSEDIDAQASRVAAIDAQLEQLQVQFEKSVLRAPFAGICIARLQDEGVTLSPGQIVLQVNEANRLKARFSIPQDNLNLVSEARYLEVGGRQYPVSLPRAISQVDAVTRSVDIVIPLHVDESERVLPGQTCAMTLVKRIEAECVELPISALVASVRGLWSCYQLQPLEGSDAISRVIKVEVSVIHTDGVRAYVASSLPDQAMIVSEGVHKLVPGMHVRVVERLP